MKYQVDIDNYEPLYPENAEQYTAIEQLALAGYKYIVMQTESPMLQTTFDCGLLVDLAEEVTALFNIFK